MIILYVQSVCLCVCSVHASVGNMGSYMIFTLALALALASGFCLFLRSPMNCCHYLQFSKIAFCSPFWAVCFHYCFALRFVFVCVSHHASARYVLQQLRIWIYSQNGYYSNSNVFMRFICWNFQIRTEIQNYYIQMKCNAIISKSNSIQMLQWNWYWWR